MNSFPTHSSRGLKRQFDQSPSGLTGTRVLQNEVLTRIFMAWAPPFTSSLFLPLLPYAFHTPVTPNNQEFLVDRRLSLPCVHAHAFTWNVSFPLPLPIPGLLITNQILALDPFSRKPSLDDVFPSFQTDLYALLLPLCSLHIQYEFLFVIPCKCDVVLVSLARMY